MTLQPVEYIIRARFLEPPDDPAILEENRIGMAMFDIMSEIEDVAEEQEIVSRVVDPDRAGAHDGHDIANLTSLSHPGGAVGRRVCLDCDVILGPLALCGQKTKAGKSCRVAVRTDLGHTTCWSHGEGRGRTSTPRKKAS